MTKFFSAVKRFASDEAGITAIEYGLIAALMASAVVAGMLILAPAVSKLFTDLGGKIVLK